MRPCWKPDSSPLRSDQGESRTPMPLQARRSKRRVSPDSTTWPASPDGYRTHLPSLRGRQCVGQELNLHSVHAGGLQPLRLANAQPTRFPVARVGVEPTDDHQGLSLAALPSLRTVPSASPMGFEPTSPP